jgi:DNA adenine methylase
MPFKNETTAVDPINPPAAYIGGKRVLSNTIVAKTNATPHTGDAEAFVGMGGVFFKRTQKPKTEVINDRNGEVANLFRILQRHYPQFMETLKFQITSRREFQRLVACDPSTLTDLERAARLELPPESGPPTGIDYPSNWRISDGWKTREAGRDCIEASAG